MDFSGNSCGDPESGMGSERAGICWHDGLVGLEARIRDGDIRGLVIEISSLDLL